MHFSNCYCQHHRHHYHLHMSYAHYYIKYYFDLTIIFTITPTFFIIVTINCATRALKRNSNQTILGLFELMIMEVVFVWYET